MSTRVTSDLLLVGSLPVESTEEAFRAGSAVFGDLVFAMPDGEPGERAAWIWYDQARLIEPHPDVETVTVPPAGGPRSAYEVPASRIRDGVTDLRFDSWPRIDDAIASYEQFAALRRDGVIADGLRFQVCLPFPESALTGVRVDFPAHYSVAAPGFEELVARELERLTAEIPPDDLAIQWDICTETLDIEGVLPWSADGAWERFAGPVERLSPMIPEEVLLGYHLCYGTFPEWPMYEARDLSLLVRMANHAVAHSGRRVDWLHLAGPRALRSEDERFYRPLSDLQAGDARVFLGIVLPVDGVEGMQRRHATASKYLADFGVAMYCGFGRQPGSDGTETMREHAQVARAARA